MVKIRTYKEIQELKNISQEMKEELSNYFKEIIQSVYSDADLETSTLDDIGIIILIEADDTIDSLRDFSIMEKTNPLPVFPPEFALNLKIDDLEFMKIIWVCSASFALAVYYPDGKFGSKFDDFIKQYIEE